MLHVTQHNSHKLLQSNSKLLRSHQGPSPIHYIVVFTLTRLVTDRCAFGSNLPLVWKRDPVRQHKKWRPGTLSYQHTQRNLNINVY